MSEILTLTVEHIYIVFSSVFLACIFSIPFAIIIYKKNFHVNTITNILSLFQSFPSIGLFAIFVPILGIGVPVAIFTLFLYAIMTIFINTIQGFKNINPQYYSMIETMDISKKDIFFKIELPIIIPSIITGVRVTTIYAISIATIATLIGAGGLGDLIYLGLQQLDLKITMSGIIPLLILTIITNHIFNYIEHKLLPADQKHKLGIKIR